MRIVAILIGALVAATTALAGTVPEPVALRRPTFPPPAKEVTQTGARLVLVSSTPRAPSLGPLRRRQAPGWVPRTFAGDELQSTIRQGNRLFLLYGPDTASGRYLIRGDRRTQALVDAYDFHALASPPRGGWFEPVTWAREAGGVLYVSNSHLTYASATKRRNAYLSAIDLGRKRTLWRSPALVANARTFVVTGDLIVAGYGFTRERDFLYLLHRRTGKVLDRIALPTAPEVIRLRDGLLHVRTYDHDVVARITRAG